MTPTIEPGGRVEQLPGATVAYELADGFGSWWQRPLAVSAARPARADVAQLRLSIQRDANKRQLVVSGGQAGVSYTLSIGEHTCVVRVTRPRPAAPAAVEPSVPRIRVVI